MSLSGRHREVLDAALELIAERGYHGASLRELAHRLGIQQPSLYHYFESKEELVEQIIRLLGSSFWAVPPTQPFPQTLADVPDFVRHLVERVYENPRYPAFVRFVFAISTSKPRFREPLFGLFREVVSKASVQMLASFIRDTPLTEREARYLVRLMTHAVGLAFIEEYVVFGASAPSDDLRRYGAFAADVVSRGIDALLAERTET